MSRREAGRSRLMDLPTEILLTIADFLDTPRDVSSFLRTARRFANLLESRLYQLARAHICTDGNTVLEWAAERGHAPVIRKVLRKTTDGDAPIPVEAKNKALCLAAKAGMLCTIQFLVTAGADPSSTVDVGQEMDSTSTTLQLSGDSTCTALQIAAKKGHEKAIQLLLQMGANISVTDSRGQTALHYAAAAGHETVTRLLLEWGADIAASKTALHYAVLSGHEAVVRLLLEKGADLEATTENEHTALHCATSPGNESILNLLLQKGANVSATEPYREQTPLHMAFDLGDNDEMIVSEMSVRLLLENGADVMARDFCGHTPLHYAAETRNEAVVRLLLEKGADVSAVAGDELEDGVGGTAQDFATDEAIIRLLKEAANA